jgi:hypothetical protein
MVPLRSVLPFTSQVKSSGVRQRKIINISGKNICNTYKQWCCVSHTTEYEITTLPFQAKTLLWELVTFSDTLCLLATSN